MISKRLACAYRWHGGSDSYEARTRAYTAIVPGKTNANGIALVEVTGCRDGNRPDGRPISLWPMRSTTEDVSEAIQYRTSDRTLWV